MTKPHYPYAPYYCEENVWHLCQLPQFAGCDSKVALLSNRRRACLLQEQRAACNSEKTVFWDYHVILLVKDKTWQVWDLDTTLGLPVEFSRYVDATFPADILKVAENYGPMFRVLNAPDYVNCLSSDRSHMRNHDGSWSAPPPQWPLIQSAAAPNLMQLTDMDNVSPGKIMTLREFSSAFSEVL